jgi:hypothetical protein
MTTYRVMWKIDIDAETPREAAERAHKIMLNPESTATVFEVEEEQDIHIIDVLDEEGADEDPV